MRTISGVIPPLVTPLDERGALDSRGLSRLIDRMLQAEVDGLFLAGSTGEGANLPDEVYYELVRRGVAESRGLPVYVGVSENGVLRAKAKIDELAGCDLAGVVVTAPSYFRYSEDMLVDFFLEVADYSPFPVIVYNIPSNNHVYLTPGLIMAIAEHENICGLKDSSGRFADFQRLLAYRQRGALPISLLQGCEELILAAGVCGADGVIPGIANVAASLCVELWLAARRLEMDRARKLQAQVLDAMRIYQQGPWVTALKRQLADEGVCQRYATPPFGAPGRQ